MDEEVEELFQSIMNPWLRSKMLDQRGKIVKWKEDNREKVKELHKKWYQANKEKVRENSRRWQENNREKVRENSRRWQENNREKVRERNRRCYWKKKNAKIQPQKAS